MGTPKTAWQTTLAGTADDSGGDGGRLWRGLGGPRWRGLGGRPWRGGSRRTTLAGTADRSGGDLADDFGGVGGLGPGGDLAEDSGKDSKTGASLARKADDLAGDSAGDAGGDPGGDPAGSGGNGWRNLVGRRAWRGRRATLAGTADDPDWERRTTLASTVLAGKVGGLCGVIRRPSL